MAEQNGILKYDAITGLKVGTKAEIQQDLQNIWKTAYGNDVVIDQGTETYSFIDLLSSLLTDMGNAAKEMYDSLSFATAGTYRDDTTLQGAPLDMLCSLVGISRKQGESDTELRHRYYAYLYQQSVGTSEGLRAQMLKIQLSDFNNTKFNIKDAYIYNNGTGENKTITYPATATGVINTVTIPGHSILPVIRIEGIETDLQGNETKITDVTTSKLYSDTDLTNFNLIKDCIENYKSLGCGLYTQTPSTESAQWWCRYHDATYAIIAMPIKTSLTIKIALSYKDYITLDSQQLTGIKNGIQQALQSELFEYLSNFALGQDLAYGDIVGRCYAEIDKLNYTSITCSITGVSYETHCALGGELTLDASDTFNICSNDGPTKPFKDTFNVPYLCYITPKGDVAASINITFEDPK